MLRQGRSLAALAVVSAALTSCGSPAPTASARATARSTPVPVATTPTAVPIPSGPYAVVVSNQARVGTSYDVMLVDVAGQVVARTTAKLPLLNPNQDISLPLVSASNDMAYFLDGDTEIHSLSPNGTVALVKTVAQGAGSILAFSVSPDDQRVAVSLINESSVTAKDTSHGWIEDLATPTNHLDLFDNTGTASFRWPVGWAGAQIVDGVGYQCGYGYGYSPASGTTPPCSFHVIDSVTTSRTATLCESPSPPPSSETDNLTVNGVPVAAGTACVESDYYYSNPNAPLNQNTLFAVDWSGRQTTFLTSANNQPLGYGNCFLSPPGTQMACSADSSQALTLLAPQTAPHNLGRRYNVLGWIDATHLLVNIDSSTLGVLSTDTGATVNLTMAGADKMGLAGTLPGAL